MLRRRFLISDTAENPDFTITYYAPQHIPFLHPHKRDLYSTAPSFDTEYMTFNVVLDTWSDGIGTYGIKITNDVLVWYNCWTNDVQQTNLLTFLLGCLGVCASIDGIEYDYSNTITDVIFSNGIQHLERPILSPEFLVNSSIVNVTLPNDLHTLGDEIFKGLKALQQIDIPESVINIGNHIVSIGFPNDTINNTERTNTSLQEIVLRPTIPPTLSSTSPINIINNNVIDSNFKIKVYADCIDTYKNDAMWGQYSNLYDIINSAIVYYHRDQGRLVYMETDDITTINNIFPVGTTEIYLPNTLVRIENYAFYNCSLTSIVIPASVTSIGEKAFSLKGIETITWNATSCVTERYALENNTSLKLIVFGNNVTSIPSFLCNGCSNLLTVLFGNSLNSIGNAAFQSCSSLTSIVIPDSVVDMGKNTFASCTNLTSVIIGKNTKRIGDGAFVNCTSLNTITIHNNNYTFLIDNAFSGCTSLNNIYYEGTISLWNKSYKATGWNSDIPATVVHCTDGDVEI